MLESSGLGEVIRGGGMPRPEVSPKHMLREPLWRDYAVVGCEFRDTDPEGPLGGEFFSAAAGAQQRS